jgi:hypothetical protein
MSLKSFFKKILSKDDSPSHPDFGDIMGDGDFIPNDIEFAGLEDEQHPVAAEPEKRKRELHWFITGMFEHISHDIDVFTGQYDKKRKQESDNRDAYEQFEQLAYGKR